MFIKKKKDKLLLFFFFSLLSLLLPMPFKLTGLVDRWEGILYDLRMRLASGSQKAHEQVAVILIDEASIKAMNPLVGRWPWPRSVHGDVIEFLTMGGARLIIFDILFTEVSEKEQDLYLALKTRESGRVVHAFNLFREEEITRMPDLPQELVEGFSLKNATVETPDVYNNYALPYRELYLSSSGLGVVEFAPDKDGVYRRTSLIKTFMGNHFPNLALAGFLSSLGDYRVFQGRGYLRIESRDYTADIPYRDGRYLVKFYGNVDVYSMSGILASIQAIRSGELQNMMVNPLEFRDRVVFIGASAVGLEDLKPTPVGATTPGVLMHAFTYSNLLLKDFLKPLPTHMTYVAAFFVSFIISLSMLWGIKRGVAISAIMLILFVLFAFLLFWYNVVVEVVYPFLSGGFNFLLTLSYLALKEEREKLMLRRSFERYVSPAVLAELEKGTDDSLIGRIGTKVELSILFSDIRGFTSLAENLPPEKTVELLNIYFDRMVEVIFSKGGTIDKFIGDAILAFWGAPVRMSDHAKRAVQTALLMRKALEEVNRELNLMGLPSIQNGIGINTAEVVLGNVGSKKRMDYTVIGDGVNLASRLEGLTKLYGAGIIISENTANKLGNDFVLRLLDLVRVKGKREPVRIYQVLENSDTKLAELTSKAFELYVKGDWQEALQLYENILQLYPQDRVCTLFVTRCRKLLQEPPRKDWDGVWELKEK